jgi:glucose-6-phosphate 1-epimerase
VLNTNSLNQLFGIDNQLSFYEGEGGFIFARISNSKATAIISTYAGQVLSWLPANATEDVLFVSKKAFYAPGKAIKGGIPVCWPWFGTDPQGRGAHGFVRNRQWQVTASAALADGGISLTLKAVIDDVSLETWSFPCELEIVIEVSEKLCVTMVTRNLGELPMPLTQALHTYFKVADISQVAVNGLDQLNYFDAIDGNRFKQQNGDVRFDAEVDRIYQEVGNSLTIDDPSMNRCIRINSQGSHSAIVWNPWIDKSKSMADFDDEEYRQMLCVETANAGNDRVMLEPGSEYRLMACYTLD